MPTETTTSTATACTAKSARDGGEEKGVRADARNKLLMMYSIVVVVVLALIIVNTSVLNRSMPRSAREAALNAMDVAEP